MNEGPFHKSHVFFYVWILLTGGGYYWLCYHTARENFYSVFALFTLLFYAYFVTYRYFSILKFKYLAAAGILFRLLLLFSIPNLSNDVYRFIWDGRLAANGINPLSYTPAVVIEMKPMAGITKELYHQLNSPHYYTIYPPVLQCIFWIAAKLFPSNEYGAILFLRSIILIADAGILFVLMQLLKKLSLSIRFSLLYFLNPLVITELTGNIHFEGVMILFLLLSFFFLLKNKWFLSAVFIGLGIATKLVPVLFLPLAIRKLGWKKGLLFAAVSGLTFLTLFIPLLDMAAIQHLLQGIDLFIRRFEFNASIYYLIRWMGRLLMGYNMIALLGPLLSLTAAILIFKLSFTGINMNTPFFFAKALFIITAWFIFSTTVHPWYICLPVALAVLTPYRYAIIWSWTATLSYAAYQHYPVQENLWLVGGGYLLMFTYACWEIKRERPFYMHSRPKVR